MKFKGTSTALASDDLIKPRHDEGAHFRAPAIKREPLFWDDRAPSLAIAAALVLACFIVVGLLAGGW